MATVRPILLKSFQWIPIHVLCQNSFDLHGRKYIEVVEFTNIRLGHSHPGRHLEYLKLLKGDNSTQPQISLYS